MEGRRPHHGSAQDQAGSVSRYALNVKSVESLNRGAGWPERFNVLTIQRFNVLTVRLQKFLAEAGVTSRRASEEIILAGRVAVNGQPVQMLGTKVDPVHDRVTVDGKAVRPRPRLYLALHKPRGCVCSHKDE